MLSISDTPIERFLPVFAKVNVDVAFLVPTPTGMKKSIMDATAPIRDLLYYSHVHDYSQQAQGPENRHYVVTHLVTADGLIDTKTSLYRPVTKHGDPRIWIYGLQQYCKPCNLLALTIHDEEIYVHNLSDPAIVDSLLGGGYAFGVLSKSVVESTIERELLTRMREIRAAGPLRSITPGDPGVGDTLEHALGIERNNSKKPDFKGIELKATRLSRDGKVRTPTRSTLFSQVPDEGLSYREIVEKYGKMQVPRGSTEARQQLYETFRVSRPNAYGLILNLNDSADRLEIQHVDENDRRSYVASWSMRLLRDRLRSKHPETFWIGAESQTIDGVEYFTYVQVIHTKNPNASLIAPLIESDKITLDLAAHFNKDGRYRDHGALFKMEKDDLPLLFPDPERFDL